MAIRKINEVAFIGYGAEGKDVEEMQKLLQLSGSNIKVTGKYTIGMVSAVRAFQKKNKLPVTGAIDVKTMKALEGLKKKPVKRAPVKKSVVKPVIKKTTLAKPVRRVNKKAK